MTRVFLFIAPRERLLLRRINKAFCKLVSISWKIQIVQISNILTSYDQVIDAYPGNEALACKEAHKSLLRLESKVRNFSYLSLTYPQCVSCAEFKQLIICLGLLFDNKEADIPLERPADIFEFATVINLLKEGFDPLATFGKNETKKGRKMLRNLSTNERLYSTYEEMSNLYSFCHFTANAHRIAKKLTAMPILEIVLKKHTEEKTHSSLSTIYNTKLYKYNP